MRQFVRFTTDVEGDAQRDAPGQSSKAKATSENRKKHFGDLKSLVKNDSLDHFAKPMFIRADNGLFAQAKGRCALVDTTR